jgi:uncharacterized protein YbjT (DUF2867 family)
MRSVCFPERLQRSFQTVSGTFPAVSSQGEGLDAFVEGVDAVVHLVGIIREVGVNTFTAVHHVGTVNIIAAASRADLRRYVHMSAMGARIDASSRYHKTKWAGEEAVRASGLDWTIFRPSTIFGPGDSFINMLADIMRKTPIMPVISGGWSLMQPVFVNDVAASFRVALESDLHVGRTYELGGPDMFTLNQILKIVSQHIESKTIFLNAPTPFVFPVVKLAQLFKITLPVTSDQLIMLGEDNVRTGGDPIDDLGIDWTSFEEGIGGYLSPNRE